MRLTVPHWHDFGADRELVGADLRRPEAWDALRTRTSGAFALPDSREELERSIAGRDDIRARAEAISDWLDARGTRRVASYGVGGAALELWLRRLRPELELVVSDYAPATVERLARLFPEAEVTRHDLVRDPPLDAELHLLHRVDTELGGRDFRALMRRFEAAEMLVVAAVVADLPQIAAELRRWAAQRGRATRAGYLRTRDSFEALWRRTHDATPVRFADLDGWHLRPRA